MMAQSLEISWAEAACQEGREWYTTPREIINLPPVFVGSSDASTLFSALESSVPELKLANLTSLNVGIIVLSLGGDLDSGTTDGAANTEHRCFGFKGWGEAFIHPFESGGAIRLRYRDVPLVVLSGVLSLYVTRLKFRLN
jgi:hypothetical protein